MPRDSCGVALVAAAGNASTDLARYLPAAYDEVVAVTAMTDLDGLEGGLASTTGTCVPSKDSDRVADDSVLYFSNFATLALDEAHTLAAPGTCITSTRPGGGYSVGSGTSFAAAHATGVIARCFAGGACDGLSPAAVTADLVGTVTTYNQNDPAYGFAGDPLHPAAGKHFGYLLHACWDPQIPPRPAGRRDGRCRGDPRSAVWPCLGSGDGRASGARMVSGEANAVGSCTSSSQPVVHSRQGVDPMKRTRYALLVVIAVAILATLLLVSSALAGAKGGGKKWGAGATPSVVA